MLTGLPLISADGDVLRQADGAQLSLHLDEYVHNVRNSSNLLERFQVGVGTRTGTWQRALPHEILDRCNWAGFTMKNPVFQYHNLGCK